MNSKSFQIYPPAKTLLLVSIALLLSSCFEVPSSDDNVLPENQRYIDGNLTWPYLNQFLEPNPTADLTGTWVGLNELTDTYFLLHMSAEYDTAERYYYYEGIRSGTAIRSRIKTDDSFRILEVTYSSGNDITQHSAGDFEFRSLVGNSFYRLKKISNKHVDIGTLSYSLYLYADDEIHQITDSIIYYEEDWREETFSDYASFNWAMVETKNNRSAFFTLSGGRYYCNTTTEIISVVVYQENCFETDISSSGVSISFDSIDKDGSSSKGSYRVNQ